MKSIYDIIIWHILLAILFCCGLLLYNSLGWRYFFCTSLITKSCAFQKVLPTYLIITVMLLSYSYTSGLCNTLQFTKHFYVQWGLDL